MTKTKQEKHPIEAFAEIDGMFSLIEEVVIPDIEKQLQEIREACKAGWKISQELQKQLKINEEAGS